MSNSKDNGAGVGDGNAAVDGDVLRPYQEAVNEAINRVKEAQAWVDTLNSIVKELTKKQLIGNFTSDEKERLATAEAKLAAAKAELAEAESKLAAAKAELAIAEAKRDGTYKDKEKTRLDEELSKANDHLRSLTASRPQQPTGEEKKPKIYPSIIQAAFKGTWKGGDTVVDILWESIKGILNKRDEYHSLILPMIQSSGWGKSRLISRLAEVKKGKAHIVYISLSASTQPESGYPVKTVCAAESLKSNLNSDPLRWRNAVCRVARNLKRGTTVGGEEMNDQEFWEAVKEKMEAEGQVEAEGQAEGEAEAIPVIICVDEIGELLNDYPESEDDVGGFRKLRRAFKPNVLPKPPNTVLVVTGTSSRLANFVPPEWKRTASLRAGTMPLPSPFIGFVNDIMRESNSGGILPLGRPMWQALHGDDDNTSVAVRFAATKLCGGDNVDEMGDQGQKLTALASVLCRVGFPIKGTLNRLEQLVDRRMAKLVAVDPADGVGVAMYVCEPVLAAGGAYITKKLGINAVIRAVHEVLDVGLLADGTVGEMIVALLLLFAIDCGCDEKNILPDIAIADFLNNLIQDQNALASAYKHLNGRVTVRFNHFMHAYSKTLTQKHLEVFYKHGAAIICAKNAPGIDLVIPFKTAVEGYGAIMVSVKNYKKWLSVESSSDFEAAKSYKLTPEYAFGAGSDIKLYVRLYIDVGPGEGFKFEVVDAKDVILRDGKKKIYPSVIVLEGLDQELYKCIDATGANMLLQIGMKKDKLLEERMSHELWSLVEQEEIS